VIMITALAVSFALSTTPPPAKNSSETVKAMKDAIAAPSDGPDVSTMPFTPESIKTVVAYYQPKIQGCYEEHLAGLKSKKVPEGKLVTSWVITPEGLVKKAAIVGKKSQVKIAGMNDCVIAVLSIMSFPKPDDKKEHPIEFPFNLKAVH